MLLLEAQCTNSCTSRVPLPNLWDQTDTSSPTSSEGSQIVRGLRLDQETPLVCNRGQGGIMGGLQIVSGLFFSVLIG